MEEALMKLGLTRNEARVYKALLALGSATVTELARASHVERTLVYGLLDKLEQHGLASTVWQDGKQHYQAAPPEQVLEILEGISQEVKSVMPELETLYAQHRSKQVVRHYKGMRGMQTLIKTLLDQESDYYVFVLTGLTAQTMPRFMERFHKERIRRGVHFYGLASTDSLVRAKKVNAMELATVRLLPDAFASPTHVTVTGNAVGIAVWTDEPIGVIIEDEQAAESFRQYFNGLWSMAKSL